MSALGRFLALAFVRLRWLVLLASIGGVVWAGVALPPLSSKGSGAVRELLPQHSPALRAEQLSIERFAFPVLARTMIVVRDPHGLAQARQASLVTLAGKLSFGKVAGFGAVAGAIPLLNTVGAPPFSREPGTTAILYLFFRPSVSPVRSTQIAQRLVRRQIGHRPGEFEGVTGALPGQVAQSNLIEERLPWVEIASLLLVALAVALHFRALGAALVTLGAVISAYVVAERLVALLGRAGGIALPPEMDPVLIVLVIGVATDYSIFFTARFRGLLAEGRDHREAAVLTVRQITPIVVAAGFTVAAGTASLLVAHLSFLSDFGPGLAVAVLIAMVVAAIMVPAALATGGRRLFWPRQLEAPKASASRARSEAASVPRFAPARMAARHPIVAVVVAVVAVLAGASGLRLVAVGNELILGLPASSEPHSAYIQAQHGFAPGVLAPTVAVVTGPGVGRNTAGIERLQSMISRQRDIAQVLGPQEEPLHTRFGVVVSKTENAVRYLIFLNADPLGARALSDIRALKSNMPTLLRRAGMPHAHAVLGGDTALSADIVDNTLEDLERVTPVMLVAIFLIIAIFLRALVAPLYLVATSILAVLSSLGLAVYVTQQLGGYGQVTYYVIFTVAVLLVSLGSDYNVFLIGRIWQHGRRRPLRNAVEVAAARASRPITVAGLVLASAFALLAIVPVHSFREIAFAMTAGLLIDAFIVRTILVPALVVLVGPQSAWPGSLRDSEPSAAERGSIEEEPSPAQADTVEVNGRPAWQPAPDTAERPVEEMERPGDAERRRA